MPICGEIVAQPRQRTLVQKAGEIVRAVGQQLAAAEPDEEIEIFAAGAFGVRRARRRGERRMRKPERRWIDLQRTEPAQQVGSRRLREQQRKQSIFSRARRIDVVDGLSHPIPRVEVGPQDFATDTGFSFDREHTLRGNPVPGRH